MTVTVVFYANAGNGVGLGHLLRLYPLYRELQSADIPARMIVPLNQDRLEALGIADALSIDTDRVSAANCIGRTKPSLVVIDTYEQPNRLLRDFKKSQASRLAVFDDHNKLNTGVDYLINASPVAHKIGYERNVAKLFLLGPRYFPLSQAFVYSRRHFLVREQVGRVLVSLGGEDTRGNLKKLIERAANCFIETVAFDVIGTNMPKIKTANVRSVGWVSPDELAVKLVDYDLAILAGGSMLYQFACVGLPVICWPQTINQKKHALGWRSLDAIEVINTLDELMPACKTLSDWKNRKRLSEMGRKIVDGKGTFRLLNKLDLDVRLNAN